MAEPGETPLRIGTRGSRLALTQSGQLVERLRAAGIAAELVVIQTSGDRLLDTPLARIGGKGLFIKELEEALTDGAIDCAIHSLKDVPAQLPPGFALAAVSAREDPCDVLVPATRLAVPGVDGLELLAALPPGCRIGTGSLRRRAQILARRPDLTIIGLRGNVDTRLKRAEEGVVDVVVLAAAGLRRLGLEVDARPLSVDVIVPSSGQGALAIEIRADRPDLFERLKTLQDPETAALCSAERAFCRALGASCVAPVAAFATTTASGQFRLTGLVAGIDGYPLLREFIEGALVDAERLGEALARRLLERGAGDVLASVAHDAPD